MNKLMALCLLAAVAFTACNETDKKKINEDSYKETKENLGQTEKKHPLRFLKTEADFHKNLLGKTVIKTKIINTATLVTYKNIRLKLLYYKDGKLFENHEEIVDEKLAPGAETSFKAKYRTQEHTDSVSVSVMSAEVAD